MDDPTFISKIAQEQNLKTHQVHAVAALLEDGATIPFIARYRKEATESLDEVSVTASRVRLNQLREIRDRRKTILKSLERHGHLTDELQERVMAAETMAALEDVYLPFKPKRRTRAVMAKEKGLEPLARDILAQNGTDPVKAAASFIDFEKGVPSAEDALGGARDIMAEIINEDEEARGRLRNLFFNEAMVKSRVAADMAEKGVKFRDYFEWDESVAGIPSHRMLAIRRGEKEDVLNLEILPDEQTAIAILEDLFVKGDGEDSA